MEKVCVYDADRLMRRIAWVVVTMVVLVLALAAQGQAAEQFTVNAVILEEVNGVTMTRSELKVIEQMKKLAENKADLQVTTMSMNGRLEKLNFSSLGIKNSANVTVALFPRESGLPEISYLISGGFFVAADPASALKLLKKYL